MLRTFMALVMAFGLFTAGCGGDTEGLECESAGDCDDGQICARLAACAGDDCPAICGRPCDGADDCAEGEVCAETAGSAGRICQDSRTIEDF